MPPPTRGTSADRATRVANLAPEITALKGELQAAINLVTTLDAAATANPDSGKRLLPDMQQQLSIMGAKFAAIYDKYTQVIMLAEQETTGAEEPWIENRDQTDREVKSAMGKAMAFIAAYREDPPPPHQQPAGQLPVAAPPQQQQWAQRYSDSAVDGFRPELLTEAHTPVEFRNWLEMFQSYYSASNGAQMGLHDQKMLLLNQMDKVMKARMKRHLPDGTLMHGNDGMLSIVEEQVMVMYPLTVRRRTYLEHFPQPKGVDWATWTSQLEALKQEARISEMTGDQLHNWMMCAYVREEDIKRQLGKIESETPTLDQVMNGADKAIRQRLSLRSGKIAEEEVKRLKPQKSKNKGRDRSESQQGRGRSTSANVSTCHNCLLPGHYARDCRKQTVCRQCKKPGHKKKECPSNKHRGRSPSPGGGRGRSPSPGGHRGRSKARRVKEGASQDVEMEDVSDKCRYSCFVKGEETPTFMCKFVTECNMSFECKIVPDTGATKSVMSHDVLDRHGIVFRECWDISLSTATGATMRVEGYITLQCTTEHGRTAYVQPLVARDSEEEFLMSWVDLIALGYLPENFPYPIEPRNDHRQWCRCLSSGKLEGADGLLEAEIATAKASILSNFSDVLCDRLGKSVMKCEPMVIHLRTDIPIVPYHMSVARKVPRHFEEPAEKLTNELNGDGVIEPVYHPTDWCSPAHFVEKPGGGR